MQRRLCFAALLLQQSRRRVSVGARPASSASAPLPAAKPPPTRRAFVDKARVQVIGGRGGKGVVSFEASSGDGWSKRPAGGTGGRGGSIVVRASASTQDLHMQTFVIRGRDGGEQTKTQSYFLPGANGARLDQRRAVGRRQVAGMTIASLAISWAMAAIGAAQSSGVVWR